MRLALPDVFAQHRDGFSVGVGVEVVAALDKDSLELFVCFVSSANQAQMLICGNLQLVMIPSRYRQPKSRFVQFRQRLTVDQRELSLRARDVRVAVQHTGDTVGCPSGVGHGSLGNEGFVHVQLGTALDVRGVVTVRSTAVELGREWSRVALCEMFTKSGDFAYFLEEDDGRFWGVAVDSDTYSRQPGSGKRKTRNNRTYRQNHTLGTLVSRDHCTTRRIRTCGPSR